MNIYLNSTVFQIFQVLTVLACSPFIAGFISKIEEIFEGKTGPSVFQPYYDLYKLFHKEILIPVDASFIFKSAPFVSFISMVLITLLIPVLTIYPLPLGFMGDMLGGAFLFSLSSFFINIASLDLGTSYGGLGSSRATLLAILSEPTLILVFVGVALIAQSTLPYVMLHTITSSLSLYFSPPHFLIIVAFFLLFLADTDRRPINASTHVEMSMIEEARILDYSGPYLALLKWSGYMKQFLLLVIFLNVLVFPWGLSVNHSPSGLIIAIISLIVKMLIVGFVAGVIDTAISRLRFFRYQEYFAAAFVLSVLAIMTFQYKGF
ncbi:MAG: NADH-quinone oxidoreductase subunit H [Deltaproteobacteria bacterium]|jgi:formate hydrogenlyase subunit 4|nr:NADH-quinone oxidoreductase subunit H [Deltaproteobacteria bacterium]MCL5879938.1 NADH-quinone oxidoreductase subunit H [Deltaproteobacteria bacterium]MDA8304339.1 NADH-quinone oxidoreductase subunit H [Deltaproteobacteria bacterium]